MANFKNPVALITGAGRGVGRALALALAEEGAIIAANDITPINLDETLAQILQTGGQAKDYVTDISKKMPVQAMLNEIIDDWGRIDILINNAHVDPQKSILDLDEWDWRRAVDVNLTGPFLTTQSVARIMKAAGGGIIINIFSGQPGHAALKASQLGLINFTISAAAEFSAYNIRVNALAPASLGLPLTKLDSLSQIRDIVNYLCSAEAENVQGKVIAAKYP
jgi:NAD(P)-dependent dehydrogenase (short-subunit alcohol dehydrogenase family)